MSMRKAMIRKEFGFGLIELMVSLVMASFLVLGLIAMIGNVQRTYTNQTEFSAVNDKERFAASFLGNLINTTGYYSLDTVTQTFLNTNSVPLRSNALPPATHSTYTYAAGQSISGLTGSSATVPDTLNLRFETDSTDTHAAPFDCSGAQGTGGGVYESQLSIDNGNLVCKTGLNGANVGSETVLLDGVSNMKILYGIDTQNSGSVAEYVSSTAVSGAAWSTVRSIKIVLTFATTTMANASNVQPTYTQTFQVTYAESST